MPEMSSQTRDDIFMSHEISAINFRTSDGGVMSGRPQAPDNAEDLESAIHHT